MKSVPDEIAVGGPRCEARMVVDAHGQIRDATQEVHRLLAYAEGSLVGLSLAWLMPPSRHGQLTQLIGARPDERPLSLRCVLMREDGSLLSVFISAQSHAAKRGRELALTLDIDEEPTVVAPRALQPFSITERSEVRAQQRQPTSRPTRLSARLPAPPVASLDQTQVSKPNGSLSRKLSERAELAEQLSACREMVSWLDLQLQKQGGAQHQFVRDRAAARVVLHELSTLLEHCRATLER
jgi:hypothetical protein